MEPGPLTDGSRAALRAVLEDHPMLLYVGPPPARVVNPDGTKTSIEADERTRLPLRSIGDSLDPQLARFVEEYNHTILRSYHSGLIATRRVQGVWSAAHRLDANADQLLFSLLDDPADAYVLEVDAEGGRVTLDLGSDQRIEPGMRFVLWTRGRPPRRVLALLGDSRYAFGSAP